MKIETKYDKEQTVYFMYDDAIRTARITAIEISIGYHVETTIVYRLQGFGLYHQYKLYETKEEVAEVWLKQQGLEVGLK